MGRLLLGYDISAVRPIDALPALADRPILIIHGADDPVVTLDHAERLAATDRATRSAGAPPVDVWIVPEGGHVGAFGKHRDEYQRRVLDFLNRAFDRTSAAPARPAA